MIQSLWSVRTWHQERRTPESCCTSGTIIDWLDYLPPLQDVSCPAFGLPFD
eukprot:UN18466